MNELKQIDIFSGPENKETFSLTALSTHPPLLLTPWELWDFSKVYHLQTLPVLWVRHKPLQGCLTWSLDYFLMTMESPRGFPTQAPITTFQDRSCLSVTRLHRLKNLNLQISTPSHLKESWLSTRRGVEAKAPSIRKYFCKKIFVVRVFVEAPVISNTISWELFLRQNFVVDNCRSWDYKVTVRFKTHQAPGVQWVTRTMVKLHIIFFLKLSSQLNRWS